MTPEPISPSPLRGRLMILVAAVLWSTSGAFTRFLSEPTALGLHEPSLGPLQIAAGRVLFAALVLVPFLRPRDLSFPTPLAASAVCFTLMNATFISAMALGTAANAILLQNTAPMWLYLAAMAGLGGVADRRGGVATAIGMVGIGMIIYGGWKGEQLSVVALGLASGITYSGIILTLGMLRGHSSVWVTIVNHAVAGLALLPVIWLLEPQAPMPTGRQFLWLALFGGLQLGFPYLMVARGLKSLSPQEASILGLVEPILNPVWAYLVAPEKEAPTVYVLAGGVCILGALAYRYWPVRRVDAPGPVD